MTTFGIVVAVVLVLLVLLVLGGIVASGRAARARDARLKAQVEQADQALAEARAGDNGWDPTQMEAAVRAAWDTRHHAGERISAMQLVQVVDRPGTEADEAVYRVAGADGRTHDIVLKRRGARWTT